MVNVENIVVNTMAFALSCLNTPKYSARTNTFAATGKEAHSTAVWNQMILSVGHIKNIKTIRNGWKINFPSEIVINSNFWLWGNWRVIEDPKAINATGAAAPATVSINKSAVSGILILNWEKIIPKQTAINRGWEIILLIKLLHKSEKDLFCSDIAMKKEEQVNKTIVSANKIKANGIAASFPKATKDIGIPIYP